jgi:hypothetical protein
MRFAFLAVGLVWLILTLSFTGKLADTAVIAAALAVFYGVSIAILVAWRDFSGG